MSKDTEPAFMRDGKRNKHATLFRNAKNMVEKKLDEDFENTSFVAWCCEFVIKNIKLVRKTWTLESE